MTSPAPTFASLPAATLLAICDYLGGDGHGIYGADFLRELHVPEEHIASVTRRYTSDGSHKGSIYAPGVPGIPGMPAMTGVYSLDLYRRIGHDLGLPSSGFGGRGFEARDWDRRIRAHLAEAVS